MNTRICLVLASALAATAGQSQGATVSFNGEVDLNGTGFGNTLNVLTLNPHGQATSESGSVLRSGSSDVLTGDAANQSRTRTAAELLAQGVSPINPTLVFNLNETGTAPSATLQGFTVRFMTATGATLFDATYNQVQQLNPVQIGTGGSGFRYTIALTPAESALFFNTPSNRVGLIVDRPILGSDPGPDNFFFIPTLIPAPGTGVAVAALGLLSLRRRRA